MIKKKLSFLLLLLLAVFFIGLFSTSYAVTTDFMENYITFVNQEIPTTRGGYMVSQFSGQKWQLFKDKYGTTCESYDNFLFLFPSSSIQGFRVLLWNDNENTGYWDKEYNGQQIGVTETLSVKDIFVPYDATTINNLTDSTRELPWLPAYQNMNIAYYGFYIGDKKIYTNNNLNVVSTKNWVYSNNYSDDKFEFSPTSNYFSTASIDGLSTPNNVYVYNGRLGILTLGYLEKFSNLSHIYKVVYRYSKSTGWYELNASVTDNFDNYNIQDDILTYTVDLSNLRTDTLLLFSFQPNSLDFNNQDFWLYLKSPYTYISNGIIYPSQTFSGDYYNNYNDDSNTDKITDNNTNDTENITDTLTDDSQVDNILGSNLSGDNLLNNIGYNPIQNPFSTIILNTMTNFTDALLGSGSQTLSFTVFNNTISISSDDFVLPNGELRNFISLICNGFLVYQIIKYGFQLYQWINTGRIQNLVNEANNHQYYLF